MSYIAAVTDSPSPICRHCRHRFIVTDSPPTNVPLTIGCVPAYFISCATHEAGWSPAIPFGNREYASPHVKNPYPECIRRPWQHPTAQDVEIIANRLMVLCNVQRLIFSFPLLTVVIRNDDRTYERGTLPGRVGSWVTTYYHGEAEPVGPVPACTIPVLSQLINVGWEL